MLPTRKNRVSNEKFRHQEYKNLRHYDLLIKHIVCYFSDNQI